MNKGMGIIVGIIVVVLIIVLFLALRGRPAGDQGLPAVTSPVATFTPVPTRPPLVPAPPPLPGGLEAIPSPTAVPQQGTTPVSISATGFSPERVTVSVGGSVTFTNADTESHQVASVPHPVHTNYPPLNGPALSLGQSFTVMFERAGTFGYHDHLNPGTQGTVVVR